jgi:outer membrane protein assembly factor BamA
MFCGLLPILLCFLIIQPIFGEVSDTSQYLDSSHETLQQKKVVAIEYLIDDQPVTNSETLNSLKKITSLTDSSQFSRYAIQQSVSSLFSSQRFSQIDVYTRQTSEGIVLKFDLKNVMRIQKIKITGELSDELRRTIRAAIRLKPGAMYVPVIGRKNLDSIKAVCAENGYFDADVKENTISSNGSLTYQVDLGNATVIKKFQIQGNSAIFTEQIKTICKTRVGRVYRRSTLDQDIEKIRDLYRKKYYPSTEIKRDFKHQTGVLTLEIVEGTQLLLDFVDENGRPIIQDDPIRKFLANLGINTKESERDRLRGDIISLINNRSLWEETVQDHFEAVGYHGTEVKSKILTNSPLHVEFTVKRGIRYIVTRVTFSGNNAFSDEALLREVEMKPSHPFSRLFGKRIFSQQTLLRDMQRLTILYEKAGYPDAAIKLPKLPSPEKKSSDNRNFGVVEIHYTIIENHKEVINRCLFSGNKALDTNTLLGALPNESQTPNARLVLKNYENAILKAYQDRGYIDAEILDTQYLHKTDTPVFQVEGDFSEQLDSGMLPKRLSDAFKKHGLPLAGTFIATKIGEEWSIQDFDGNARYTLEQEKMQLSVYEHGILQFEISEGAQIEFGTFSFIGDTGVKTKVLNREIAHLQGALYTPDKLNQAIQNLYSTGIFEHGIRVEEPMIPTAFGTESSSFNNEGLPIFPSTQPTVRDVEILLQKRQPRGIGASVGYSSSDGPRGTIALSHLNLFKRNIRFRLRGRGGTLGYLYDTTLTEPWLIGRTSGSLQFLGRKLEEDDGVRALQGSFSLSRKLSKLHRLNLQYSYRDLKDTSVAPLVPNPSTTVSSLRFLWRQDSRVPSLNPTSGMLNEVTMEYAGGFLGGKSSFIKIITDTRYHKKLSARGPVLATALRLGYTPGLQAKAGSDAELISFERFWVGGSTTVRGYEERGLGPEDITGKHRGNVQFIFNTELRFPIFSPIDGVFFFDAGNVWDTAKDIKYEWLPSSLGVGLRLNLGPLVGGIDYAVPLISVSDVLTDTFYIRVGSTF